MRRPRPCPPGPLLPLAIVATLLAAGPARGQWPAGRLTTLTPAGGQAGSTVEVRLSGRDLLPGSRLDFGHPGVVAEAVQDGTYRVAIAADTPDGPYDARVVGPLGISNPRAFIVGRLPEASEAEPNDDAAKAGALPGRSTVNGRIDPATDRDHFAFDGRAGDRVVLEVEANRIESRLEPLLRLADPKGVELEGIDHGRDGDPCLEYVLPADGRYVVTVQDATYGGSPEHGYRLTRHAGPVLDAVRPAVVPGEAAGPLTLLGRGFGGRPLAGVTVGGGPVEAAVSLATDAPLIRPSRGFVPARRAGRGVRAVGVPGGSGPAGRRLVATATEPVAPEVEPNDEARPQVISPPIEIGGTFDRPGDVDVYDVFANRYEVWWIEVESDLIGSPADPTLILQRIGAGGAAADVASADDRPSPTATNGLMALASVDAGLRWVVPETGHYRLIVADRYGTARGDARFAYRLRVRPERPGLRLYVVSGPAGVNLRGGGRTTVVAAIDRLDGFETTPVRVEAADPGGDGPVVLPSTIGPGQYRAEVVLEHPPGTPPPAGGLLLRAHFVASDRKDVLTYVPGGKRPPAEGAVGIPLSFAWAPEGNLPAPLREVAAMPVGVAGEAPFRLDVRPALVHARPEETVRLEAALTPGPGFAEAVEVETGDLPPGVPTLKATIAKGQPSAPIELKLPKVLAPGVYTVILRGTANVTLKRTPDAKPETIKATEPANPVTLVIHR
jgi:hypothetical protein